MSDRCEIPLTGGHVAIVDPEDYDFLIQWGWFCQTANRKDRYAARGERVTEQKGEKRGLIFMHRVLAGASPGVKVRHQNGNTLDNRRSNLVIAAQKTMTLEQRERERAYQAGYRDRKKTGEQLRPSDNYHRLSAISPDGKMAICAICGPVETRPRKAKGRIQLCCRNGRALHYGRGKGRRGKSHEVLAVVFSGRYQRHKRLVCQRCGFVAADPIQLDVHHRDHNHRNNHPDNLETICANCHRLEHYKARLKRDRDRLLIREAQS